MSPKDKALELYHKYRSFNNETSEINKTTALQCAEICVEEILKITSLMGPYLVYDFYLEVKEELLKL